MIDRKEIRKALVTLRKEYGINISPRRIMRVVGELERGEYDKSPYLKRFIESILYTTQTAFEDDVVTCTNTGEDLIEKFKKMSCSATGVPPSLLDYETNTNLKDLSSDNESSLPPSMVSIFGPGILKTPTEQTLTNAANRLQKIVTGECKLYNSEPIEKIDVNIVYDNVKNSKEIDKVDIVKPAIKLETSEAICNLYGLFEITKEDIESIIRADKEGLRVLYKGVDGDYIATYVSIGSVVAIDGDFVTTEYGSYWGMNLSKGDREDLLIKLAEANRAMINTSPIIRNSSLNKSKQDGTEKFTRNLETKLRNLGEMFNPTMTLTPYQVLLTIFKFRSLMRENNLKLPPYTSQSDIPSDYVNMSGKIMRDYFTSLILSRQPIMTFESDEEEYHFSGKTDSIVGINGIYFNPFEEHGLTEMDLVVLEELALLEDITFRMNMGKGSMKVSRGSIMLIKQTLNGIGGINSYKEFVDVKHIYHNNK